MDDTCPPSLHLDLWRTGRFPEWSLSFQDIDIIDARNNFSFGVSFRNCHSTHQDVPCPASLELESWRTEMVLERSLWVQDVPMDARNHFSFCVSFRKCHLTHQDATCPPSLALDPWRTGRVLERSHGVQDIHMDVRNHFSFCAPFRKCHLTHQDSTCPPSLELDPWRTGMVPDRSLHFNVSNNSTLWNYLKQ